MLSFHNNVEVKRKYVARTEAHRKADQIVQGTGWNGSKGCAVGCTLENYNHSQYPVELGVPEWLAHVEDTLFEGLPADRAMLWPSEFLVAIPVGVTERQFLYNVKAPFIRLVLESTLANFDHNKNPVVVAAIRGSIALWSRDDLEEEPNPARSAARSAAWSAARSAAWSAARSAAWSAARSAAESAAWSAAESAAWSAAWSAAESAAESAAWSAAWSAARSAAESAAWSAARSAARSAAESAARSARYIYFTDELLKLLRHALN